MILQVYDSQDQTLGLSACFKLQIEGTTFEKQMIKYYARDGGAMLGDGTARPVKLKLKYESAGKDDQTFLSEAAAVTKFLRNGNAPFYLRIIPDGVGAYPPFRYLIDHTSFKNTFLQGAELRFANRSIDFLALDANPEDDAATVPTPVTLNNDDFADIANPGDGLAFPIIELTALANIQSFTLYNDGVQLQFSVADFSFTTGKKYQFDFIDGNIRLFGVGGTTSIERSKAISSGGPWGLAPGNNRITYTSPDGAVQFQISFRPIYYIF